MWRELLNRLKEPSSWAAVAAVLLLVGMNLDAELWRYVVSVGSGVAGILGFILKEKSV